MPTTPKQAEIIALRTRVEDRRTTVQTCFADAKNLLNLQPSQNCAITVRTEIRWRLRRATDLSKADRQAIEAFLEDTVERIIEERKGKAPTLEPGVPNIASKSVQEEVEKVAAAAVEKAAADEALKIRPREWRAFSLELDSIGPSDNPERLAALFAEAGLEGNSVYDFQKLESILYERIDAYKLPPNKAGVRMFPRDPDVDWKVLNNAEVVALANDTAMVAEMWDEKFPPPPKPQMSYAVRWDAKGVAHIVEFPMGEEPPAQQDFRKPKRFDDQEDV